MTESFRSQRFDPERHDASAFESGQPSLDDWLRNSAATEDRRGHSRTWVWIDESGLVVGYYTLTAHKVGRESVPAKVGRGGPREIPAVLIGKLALGNRLQGQGWGGLLLADALDRIVVASAQVAARLVVVDALNEKVAIWYESLGFTRMPNQRILVQRIADIAAARGF